MESVHFVVVPVLETIVLPSLVPFILRLDWLLFHGSYSIRIAFASYTPCYHAFFFVFLDLGKYLKFYLHTLYLVGTLIAAVCFSMDVEISKFCILLYNLCQKKSHRGIHNHCFRLLPFLNSGKPSDQYEHAKKAIWALNWCWNSPSERGKSCSVCYRSYWGNLRLSGDLNSQDLVIRTLLIHAGIRIQI